MIVSCDCEEYSSASSTTFSLSVGTIADARNPDAYPTKNYRFSIDDAKSGADVNQPVKLAVQMIQPNQSSAETWLVEITYTGTDPSLDIDLDIDPLTPSEPSSPDSPDQFIVHGLAKGATFTEKVNVWKNTGYNVRMVSFGKFKLKLTREY